MEAFDQIVQRIAAAESLLLLTHARSDGDGLGSMAALARAALVAGKRAACLVPDRLPERYGFLFPEEKPAGPEAFTAMADAADLIVIVDTCAFSQLDGLEQAIRARRDKIVVVDHHATSDDVGGVQWVDTGAAAAGVMTAEIIAALGWPLQTVTPAADPWHDSALAADVAWALATAITSDTGWLRFANTDARCLRAMESLLAAGVRPDVLYARLFQCDRPQRLRLVARALASLELRCGDKLAMMMIRREDFPATGALSEETENIVNEALRIGTVESAVLLVENADQVRVSLRSRDAVDVAAVARKFGGGGHARAAGVRTTEPIEQFKEKLAAEFENVFASVQRR